MGKAIWQIYACVYDLILLKFNPYHKIIDRTVAALTPKRDRRFLDAGCGTGNFLMALAKTSHDLQLTGLDFSPAMLKRAGIKLRKVGAKADLRVFNLNQGLPFDDHFFDGVICSNVIYALSDPAMLIDELSRVLSRKGRLILTTPKHEPKMLPIIKEHINYLIDKHGKVGLAIFIWQLTLVALPTVAFVLLNIMIRGNSAYHFFAWHELEALLVKSGLEIVELSHIYGAQNWFVIAEKNF